MSKRMENSTYENSKCSGYQTANQFPNSLLMFQQNHLLNHFYRKPLNLPKMALSAHFRSNQISYECKIKDVTNL